MDESPIRVTGDLTPAFTRATGSFMGLFDAIKDCILLERQASAHAGASVIQGQAETDRKLIEAGLARVENGKMRYLVPQEEISSYLLSLQGRRIGNIQGCLQYAVDELAQMEPERVSSALDEDFADEWIESAGKRKDDYARRLWGRILARKLIEPDAISLRALHVLKQVDKREAEIFTKLVPYAFNNFILNSDEIEVSSSFDAIAMCDARITEMSMKLSADVSFVGDRFVAPGAQWSFIVDMQGIRPDIERTFKIYGLALTPTGSALLKVPDLDPINTDVLKIIFQILKERNPDVCGIGAYKSIEGSQICLEDKICEYRPE